MNKLFCRNISVTILPVLFLAVLIAGCGSGYGIYHPVGKGETLDSISSAYGVSKSELIRYNGEALKDDLNPGESIYIPGASRTITASAAAVEQRGSDYSPPPSRPSEASESTTSPAMPAVPPANIKRDENNSSVRNDSSGSRLKKGFSWPLKGKVISRFGSQRGEVHDGIDVEAGMGSPVKASAPGRVIYSGSDIKGYGNMIIIKHAGSYSTVYAHNKENKVKKGSFVKEGDVIATVGRSGRIENVALHFEIRNGKKAVDPLGLLPK